jgi:hypothetical protein
MQVAVSVGTTLFALSFIFSDAAKNVRSAAPCAGHKRFLAPSVLRGYLFESGVARCGVQVFNSFVFLFLIHPFDIGDRVEIAGFEAMCKSVGWSGGATARDGSVEAVLIPHLPRPGHCCTDVVSMRLTRTVFRIWDGRIVTIANYRLYNMDIVNIRRSGPLMEATFICRAWGPWVRSLALAQPTQCLCCAGRQRSAHGHPVQQNRRPGGGIPTLASGVPGGKASPSPKPPKPTALGLK